MARAVNMELFAPRLQSALKVAGENTYTLAAHVSLAPSTISRYVNGLMAPKVTTIHAIASFLGVNPAWLLGTEERRYLPQEPELQPLPSLSAHEQELIEAYRLNPSMHEPVRRLLGLPPVPEVSTSDAAPSQPTLRPAAKRAPETERAPSQPAPRPRRAPSAPTANDADRLKLLSAILDSDSGSDD